MTAGIEQARSADEAPLAAPREPLAPLDRPKSARMRLWPQRPPKPATPPPPPREPRKRSGSGRRGGQSAREWSAFSSSALSLLMIIGLAATFAYGALHDSLTRPGPLAADRTFFIPRNNGGTAGIGEMLERNGIVADADLFVWGARLGRNQLQAGEYAFPRGASIRQVIDIIASGRVVQHAVTIPEGLTSFQVMQRLRETDVLAGELRQIPPEGSLLPDTYYVTRGTTREELVRRMTRERERVLNEVWARRRPDLPLRSPAELVTLASIVEKETGVGSERPRVAGVFVNRLNRRMRLQSDPTIIYGITEGRGVLGRGILRSEIERPTPFNTYVIPALPPTPIANVGRAALEATANPARTNDLYFVADGTGGHAFAETLEQHQRNVARWREIERERGGQVSPGLDASAQPGAGAPRGNTAPRRPTSRPVAPRAESQ
jgi:UPF0755 protein